MALKLTDVSYHNPLTFMIESIGQASLDMTISKNVFSPAPRVDSAILSIVIKRPYQVLLTQVLKQAFTQKRKTIYNNLKGLFLENTENILNECGIDLKKRPEQLSVEDYIKLTHYL